MISVLIVDDDIATADVIKNSVAWDKMGIAMVYTAYNVSGARQILKKKPVDIIISDIEMPKESGLDLLKWVRAEKKDCEFLFLTCHESFAYATDAINLNASAYLTKPFDIQIMEMTLQKVLGKLMSKRSLKKSSDYGIWMEKNLRLMKVDFWKRVLDKEFTDRVRMENEIESRHLGINADGKFCIIVSKVSNIEADTERYGKSVFEFVLEGFHSELLAQRVENESIVKMSLGNSLRFVTVCSGEEEEKLNDRCEELMETCNQYFKATLTICISRDYDIMELPLARERIETLFGINVGSFGKIFWEKEVEPPATNKVQIIDLSKLVGLVETKSKAQLLNYLKAIFDELSSFHNLNAHSLYLMQQEIVQVVYADLMKKGIQATKLFYDDLSIRMAEQAADSTVDMIRWVNYLLSKTFEYETEVAGASTIVDKINAYIHEHYQEDITRNEIAGEFFLTPSYLAKLYKKKTGVNIKDYINEYRIEKARELLRNGNNNVSDVAEKVGFDNFSYFSTLFKKITGVSPKDYKMLY